MAIFLVQISISLCYSDTQNRQLQVTRFEDFIFFEKSMLTLFIIPLIDELKEKFPTGIHTYETTYQHDYFGKLGENREATFQYPSQRSLSPDYSYKPASRSPSPN